MKVILKVEPNTLDLLKSKQAIIKLPKIIRRPHKGLRFVHKKQIWYQLLCIINVTFMVLTNMIEMASHWRLCRKGYNWLSWGNNNLLVCSIYVSCHFEFFTWSWLSISRLIWKVIYFSTKLQTRFIMVQQSSRIFSVKSNSTKFFILISFFMKQNVYLPYQ